MWYIASQILLYNWKLVPFDPLNPLPPQVTTNLLSLCELIFVSLFNFCHFNGCVVVSHCDSNCIPLMAKDIEYLFMCLFAIHISSLVKCLFKYFAHLKKCGCSFSCWNVPILLMFCIQVLYQMHDLQILSPNLWIVFSASCLPMVFEE